MFKEMNILRLFFENPTREYNVRELARLIEIAPATASKNLKSANKETILKYRRERNIDLYSSNLESYRYRDLKVYYNIFKIRESGILDAINKEYLKPTIILFGSSATGMDTETSDIDLVIISEKTSEFKERQTYEKRLKRELQLIIVKDIKNIRNPHLINSILNGITLQGEVKWT